MRIPSAYKTTNTSLAPPRPPIRTPISPSPDGYKEKHPPSRKVTTLSPNLQHPSQKTPPPRRNLHVLETLCLHRTHTFRNITPKIRQHTKHSAMTPSTASLWYKNSILYSLHVRSFYDSDGDGIGDINGLIEKLDYLEDLGVDCLALMPFYPSPLRDDGYDVADYCNVHPECGTLEQFRRLLSEAHARNIRVVIDVLLNHTSTAHEWFQRARTSPPGSPERDFYVWSDSPERFAGAEVLFSDYESSNWEWDNVAKAYYWHRFYSHQPDLNYDNPLVRSEIRKVSDFWFQLGVDGMRLT